MRNLSPLCSTTSTLPVEYRDYDVTATTLDLDDDVLYVASEKVSDGEVDVRVWRVCDEGDMESIAQLSSPAVQAQTPQIVCFTLLPDTHTLCIITRSGDIATLSLDTLPSSDIEVVGTFSPGIHTASLSPDTTLLALLTSAPSPSLILLTPTPSFPLLSESPLHTPAHGAAAPIALGWGSKATQFHGSAGKSAAHPTDPSEPGTTTPDDDGEPRISWRGDAQYFSVSAVAEGRRVVRVYSRVGELQSTAEGVAGLEHVLAWRPSGGVIAGTQRFGDVPGGEGEKRWSLGKGRNGRHDVVFFERNGLRHGEFALREVRQGMAGDVRRWGYKVRELGWNADSSVLSVWIERDEGDVVQLWTTGNYHWYLKLEIPAPKRFTSVTWHAEHPLRLILSTHDTVMDTRYVLYTAKSQTAPPHDSGLVGVIDGGEILLTPFRTQNIPPPMSSHRLAVHASPSAFAAPPLHISFSPTPTPAPSSGDVLAALFSNGEVAVWVIRVRSAADVKKEKEKSKREVVQVSLVWRGTIVGAESTPRQVCVRAQGGGYVVGVLVEVDGADVLSVVHLATEGDTFAVGREWEVRMSGSGGRLLEESGDAAGFAWQAQDGGIWGISLDNVLEPTLVTHFPEFCAAATRVSASLFIGRCASKLYAAFSEGTASDPDDDGDDDGLPSPPVSPPASSPSHSAQALPSNTRSPHARTLTLSQTCTSYTIAGSHLIWTATAPAHEAVFARLDALSAPSTFSAPSAPPAPFPALEKRRTERGARIVTAVPSGMSLVLQMPRGNLETVCPRPLVMERVRGDVKMGDYRAAFLACRKHRVDLNVLVEEDPARFAASLAEFVEQLDDVEYINLFLSGLGRSAQPQERIAGLCDGIREELERRDVKKFVNSILTAHVVKTPPDYEAGLSLLLRLRGTDSELVEDAVKYIIFLVDADRLFDTALGMYDFSLVLLVAQHSQKDPREYLPFLRSLRALEGPYQHFKIDDHLRRHEKALRSLHRAGKERFGEAKAYVELHRLHSEALRIWREEPEEYRAMLELYGDYLFERREFQQAALAFVQALRTRKAMVAYERALDWRELFDVVLREGITGDELVDTARRIAEDLGSKQRHAEAARVLLDYVDDVDDAVVALIRGSEWSEARRIAALRKRHDLVDSLILPGTLEARSLIAEEIGEINELLQKQVSRLDELTAKKLAEPDAFYGIDDPNLANVDVMTDVSNPGTMFTRYTVAPTASSYRSRRTSRSKRKLDRKAGRKGTVDEEEYLLKSLGKLVTRLDAVKTQASDLLSHLLVLSDDHAAEGRELQSEVGALDGELRRSIDRVWEERKPPPQESSVAQGLPAESGKGLTEKVPKPSLSDLPWEVGWLAKI